MRLPVLVVSVALAVVACLAERPALAASEDAVERSVDRTTAQQDTKDDDQEGANPCKGITKNSTRKQKKACEEFMQQQ